jgi:hypothetical protein
MPRPQDWARAPRRKKPRPAAAGVTVDIATAMDDPALFGKWFDGESWDGWRAVLKAAFGLADQMTADEAAFFREVAERDPPKRKVRELWCAIGRRGGKDSATSLIAAWSAANFAGQDRLRPGERALVACLANDRDQARIILDYTRSYFDEVAPLKALIEDDERMTDLQLTNRVDLAVMSNNFRAVRGRPILMAVFDEVALWRDEKSATPDIETYRAVVPGLASLSPDAMIVGISSPYRKSGLLYDKYKKHFGQNDDDVLVVRGPSRQFNPTIPQEIVDQALADDPAAAKAEWLGEFRDDIGGWLAAEVIENAVDAGITVRPPNKMFSYFAFCDPSGGARDSFTAAIAHSEGGIAILDALLEIKPPFDPGSATMQIAALLKSYGLLACTGDRYAAEWVVAAFRSCGITYRHSERDRSAIYQDALPLFMSGRVRLLDNKRLVSQFCALERKTSSMGKDKIDHGPGGRDDACNSAAGALVLASAVKQPLFCAAPFVAIGTDYYPSFYTGAHVPSGAFDLGGSYARPGGEPSPINQQRREKQ